jgi:helicase
LGGKAVLLKMQEMKIRKEANDAVINIALDTMEKGKQALVFVGTKRSAEKQAEGIARKAKKESSELLELSEKALHALPRPTKQCERLARCIKGGAAFHHAGLTQKQKQIIEDSFRQGKIRIICCTPTLAAGVDLPAFRAVVRDLKRYGGKFGMSFIPVLEYLQMAGRAGRPRFDKFGEAIAIANCKDRSRKE